jgi:hypothetical protein
LEELSDSSSKKGKECLKIAFRRINFMTCQTNGAHGERELGLETRRISS